MKTFKGFDKDLKCRNFQYEVGKEYEMPETEVKACNGGFHSCESPLDVLRYYEPSKGRFCEVEIDGKTDVENPRSDTKIASSKIKIGAEIGIPGLIKAHIEYTRERIVKEKEKVNDEEKCAASNSGNCGAASNSGYRGAASNTNNTSVAVAWGYECRAKGCLGSYIVCAEWAQNKSDEWVFKRAKMARVDGVKIKADTFYQLINNKLTEVE